jgi:hypothetical protein
MKSNVIRKIANKISESEEEVLGKEIDISEIPHKIMSALRKTGINPEMVVDIMRSHGSISLMLDGQMIYTISLLSNFAKNLNADFNISAKGSDLLISNIKI